MKNFILLLFIWSPCSFARFPDDIQTDKQLHFLASYAIDATVVQMFPKGTPYRLLKASAISLAIGVLKEATDKEFSKSDLAADAAGIGTYMLIHYTFEF